MKTNIFKYFLLLLGFLISLIFYLSIVGIETDKFNQQIKDTVVQSNNNLDVSLKKVKLILDPLKLKINAKTIGANIYYANRPLELKWSICIIDVCTNSFCIYFKFKWIKN